MKGKKNWLKALLRILVTVAAAAAVTVALYAQCAGWPLTRSPAVEEVSRVTITNTELGAQREVTDPESIELAVRLISFLNYVPFSSVPNAAAPQVRVSYFLADGSVLEIAAGDTAVSFNGRVRRLKDEGAFIKMVNVLFFFVENAAPVAG